MTHCRICESPITPFHSFGKQPLANAFLTKDQFAKEYFFELKVCFCSKCKMVQLLDQPAPEAMFNENYAFFSGTSKLMAEHFKDFAGWIESTYLGTNPFVVEIGSNDGILLQNFAAKKIRHLGIEPSANVAAVAREKGINTISEFFNEELANKIVAEHGHADAFMAANVMCHISDFHSVIRGIAALLKPDGVCAFEDPYLGDVIEKTSYDQLYDEHVFLFAASSIQSAFNMHGLELIDLLPQHTHGGSMRYVLAKKGARKISPKVAAILEKERMLGLHNAKTYETFKANCELSRTDFVRLLTRLKKDKKRVVGYAATSKSTTVLNYCGVGPDLIEFICDTTPIKQGKFSPGMHIPVVPYEKFKASYPDFAVLFAWNHQKEILAKETEYVAAGGKWIFFVPRVEIAQTKMGLAA